MASTSSTPSKPSAPSKASSPSKTSSLLTENKWSPTKDIAPGTFLRNLQAFVKIYVGTKTEPFYIHETLAVERCEFFKKALRASFAESSTKEIRIPEEDPGIFGFVVEFLYAGGITEIWEDNDDALVCKPSDAELYKIWLTAEYLLLGELQNVAMRMLFARNMGKKTPGCGSLTFPEVYRRTSGDSPLRRFILDCTVWRGWVDPKSVYQCGVEEAAKHFTPEMMLDLLYLQHERIQRRLLNPLNDVANYLVQTSVKRELAEHSEEVKTEMDVDDEVEVVENE